RGSGFSGPVLELGTGVGLAGVILLKYTRASPIILTDFNTSVLERCQINTRPFADDRISENDQDPVKLPGSGERLRIRRLDWRRDFSLIQDAKVPASPFEFSRDEVEELLNFEDLTILAGDCVYDDDLSLDLVKTLSRLLRPAASED